ncbi:MAG: c-type cytochrome [Rubrivivax sp.]
MSHPQDKQTHATTGTEQVPEGHETPIRTPKQLIWTVLAAFLVPIVIIVLLVNFVTSETKPGAGSDGFGAEAIAQRLQPVGMVEIRDASDVGSLKTGEQVFQAQCSACHTTGAAGAPKLDDTGAWAPRIATGYDALLHSALKGKGAMAAQGGGDFSDFEIARAVVYIANHAGAKFAEPAAPDGAASAASGADAGTATADAGTAAAAASASAEGASAPK